MSGSSTQVQQTAHWTAVIATIAVSVCLAIGMVAMAAVAWRDGNTQLVNSAMSGIIQIGTGLAVTLGVTVGGPQVVSAFVGRFQNGAAVPTIPPAVTSPVVPSSTPGAAQTPAQ